MNEESKAVRIGAIIATTHLLPKRGAALTREALQGAVDHFRPGSPIFREHGMQQIGRSVSQTLRERADGEWEIYAEADIDVPPGMTQEAVIAGLGRFWSIAFIEVGDDRPESPVVTVGVDSLAFSEQDRKEARIQLGEVPVSTYVAWYHQFADAPQAAVVLDFAHHALMSLPPEVWNQLFKTIEAVLLRLIFREPRRTTPITLRMRSDDLRLDLEVPSDAKEELVKEMLRGARSLLRASDGKHKNKRN